jgi:hypothetical protein
LVNAITPALAAAYNAACGTPEAVDRKVLTIAPPRGSCASIRRISCCRHNQTLFRLSARERSNCFGKTGSRHERFFHSRSIVKSAIEAAPAVHRGLHQPMNIGGLGDVGPDEQRPSAGGFDLACHTLAALGAASSDATLAPIRANASPAARADPRTSTR